MSATESRATESTPVEKMRPSDLQMDLKNPRMPDKRFEREVDAIRHLVLFGALDELISSISSSRWMDFEPLIVLEHDDELALDYVVIEGNRRLAALRLLSDPALARELKIAVPADSESLVPEEVRIWLVKSRAEARSFIGFKHINGAYRWDSYAKAKFAADWLREQNDIELVARQLGDSHSTVLRLVNGYKVLRQAEESGAFDSEQEKFSFSHLYTGLTRPGIRNFLGLPPMSALYPDSPVAEDKIENLRELTGWLYGTPKAKPVIRSQNPDLKLLSEVLEQEGATNLLRDRADLQLAYDLVEDKSELFTAEIDRLWTSARAANGLIGHYAGELETRERAEIALRTVARMVRSMQPEGSDQLPSGD